MTIIFIAVLWCLGVWAAANTGAAPAFWIAGLIVSAILALPLHQRRGAFVAAICLVACCAGGLRTSIAVTSLNVNQFFNYGNDPEVTLTGTIIEQPRIRDTYVLLTIQSNSITGGEQMGESRGRILVRAPRYPAPAYGDRIRATGSLQRIQNWRDFDYREYLARRNIFFELVDPRLIRLEQGSGNPFYQALYALNDRAQEVVERLIPAPESALLSGILLGDDSGLPEALQEDFRVTGMSHIIAISGFNIAILAGALLRAGRRPFGLRASGWIAIGGVAIYTLFVGADAAVVRAAIMGSLYIVSNRLLGRPTFAPAGLFVAAMTMSLFDPYILWEIGFQLSFAATLGLMLFVEPLSRRTAAKLSALLPGNITRRVLPFFTETVIVTIAAQIMTLPLLAVHFGEVSAVSLLANLLILPAQPGVMFWGGAATILGLVAPALAQPLAWVAWLFLAYTTTLVELLARLPFGVMDLQITWTGVASYYLLLLGAYWLWRQPQERRQELLAGARGRAAQGAPMLLILSLGISLIWARTQPDGHLHVTFLDVGQGDAIFIQTPSGRQMLVDGGQSPSVLHGRLGEQMAFWDRHIDFVVATHPDDDHVAGLPELFGRYAVSQLMTNGAAAESSRTYTALLDRAEAAGTAMHTPTAGEQLAIGDGVQITFLHPAGAALPTDNDNSIAFRLTYGTFTLLLTGDAELEAERAMAATGIPLQALVFKAGHHGSSSSSNAFFLERVQPQVVVISAGEDNRFGHPHEELLERVEATGATVLRTDQMGSIEVITDGEGMWWEAER